MADIIDIRDRLPQRSDVAQIPDGAQSAPVLDLTAARSNQRGAQQCLAVSQNALLRLKDYAYQVLLHEGRRIGAWETHVIVHDPAQLGLGHGPQASLLMNPALKGSA